MCLSLLATEFSFGILPLRHTATLEKEFLYYVTCQYGICYETNVAKMKLIHEKQFTQSFKEVNIMQL